MGRRLAAHLTCANVMAATAVFIVLGGTSRTGIRQDAYANAHRTPVEEEKTGADRGRYLTPDVFGKPASKAIGAGG